MNQRRRIPRSLPPSTKNAYATTHPRSADTSPTAAASFFHAPTRLSAPPADATVASIAGRADGGNSCYHGRASRLPRLLPPPPTHQKAPFHFGGGLVGYLLALRLRACFLLLATSSTETTSVLGAEAPRPSPRATKGYTAARRQRPPCRESDSGQSSRRSRSRGCWPSRRRSGGGSRGKARDSMVHQFCAEIGVRRHVFKVWMHNNKRGTTRKQPPPPPSPPAKQEQLLFVLQHH